MSNQIPEKSNLTGDVSEGTFQDAMNQLIDTLVFVLGQQPVTTLTALNAAIDTIKNDGRWSDARIPLKHKFTHASGQADALSPADIGAVASSLVSNTAAAGKILLMDANGHLPANVTGNAATAAVATTAGNCTGNAATATRLSTPRKINGIAFDGTSDISILASMPYICFTEEKNMGEQVGADAGWQTRVFNTVRHDDTQQCYTDSYGWLHIPAGTYMVRISVPGFGVGRHVAWFDGLVGTSEYSYPEYPAQTRSIITGKVTITSMSMATGTEVWHRCEKARSINGRGVSNTSTDANGNSMNSIYSIAEFWKVG